MWSIFRGQWSLDEIVLECQILPSFAELQYIVEMIFKSHVVPAYTCDYVNWYIWFIWSGSTSHTYNIL